MKSMQLQYAQMTVVLKTLQYDTRDCDWERKRQAFLREYQQLHVRHDNLNST